MKVRCPGCGLMLDVGDITYEVHEPMAGAADIEIDTELELVAEEDGHRFPGRFIERDGRLFIEPSKRRRRDDSDDTLGGLWERDPPTS